jgi:CspA family cold shock protein
MQNFHYNLEAGSLRLFLADAGLPFPGQVEADDLERKIVTGHIRNVVDYNNGFEETPLMPSGTVKWFNSTKGFGFIQPDEGGNDVFVHISAVERAGLRGLNEGQKISYELKEERGKTAAVDLRG